MKKIILFIAASASLSMAFAQTTKPKKDWSKVINRPGDHIMVQFAADQWSGTPDSIKDHMKGLSRGANVYIMLDKPFKGNPRFSVAFGLGIGTTNMYFKKMEVDLTAGSSKLPFNSLDSSNHFKKYKLTTAFLEVPLELRFTADPEKSNRSLKAAIGLKVGTLLNAHTKGKTLEDKNDQGLNSYTAKESSKRHFNTTSVAATARVGYGNFSVFGSYQFNNLFKDGVAPEIKPFQIGICLSGL
jgi:hypothetical protein